MGFITRNLLNLGFILCGLMVIVNGNMTLATNTTDNGDFKVFVDHQGNIVPHPSHTKPTAMPVHHRPGLPPEDDFEPSFGVVPLDTSSQAPIVTKPPVVVSRPTPVTTRPPSKPSQSGESTNKPPHGGNKPPHGGNKPTNGGNKPFDPLGWFGSFGSLFGHSAAQESFGLVNKNGTKLPSYVLEAAFHQTTVKTSYVDGTAIVRPSNDNNLPSEDVVIEPEITTVLSNQSDLPLVSTTTTNYNNNDFTTSINEINESSLNDSVNDITSISTKLPPPQSSALFLNNKPPNFPQRPATSGATGDNFNTTTANQETIPNKGIFDWVLNLVGINNGNNNNNNHNSGKPPHEVIPAKNCPPCSCGVSFKHTRIVGGIETQVNAYPWMTILTYNGRFYCGATVINTKYLLTATHCVNGFAKERLEATFFDHDRSTPFETATFTRKISAILKHRGYNTGGAYNNDIALLKLDEDLPMNGLLKPVCLPVIGKSYTSYKGIVTGWGATESQGSVAQKLREVEVPILSNIDCRKTGYGDKITDNMMCAGYPQGNKDSCQGDSGGPLHTVVSSTHTIVGIVSWGEGCAEPNYPGVYTRVNRYISWIESNTRDACYCKQHH